MQGPPPATRSPALGLSVIVPTYGRPLALQQCLKALGEQICPDVDLEVIVVNDGGPELDATGLSRLLPCVRLLRQVNAGPGSARNAGAAAASHDWLAFTDDDCRPEPRWAADFARALASYPDGLIGGHTFNALSTNPYATASQCVIDALCCWLNRDPLKGRFVPSNNMACRKERYLAISGFDPAYRTGEDRDLCERWRRAGGRVIQLSCAHSAHAHPLTHRSFWAQHRAYGQGSWRVHRSVRQRGDLMPKAGALFLCLLLRQVVHQTSQRRLLLPVTLLVLESQLAVLVGNNDQRLYARRPGARSS